jgi:hypothetical protein
VQTVVGTSVGLALVLVLPGLLGLAAARARLSIVEVVALAPIVSLGSLWVGAEVVDVLGLAWGVPAFVVVVVALGALAVWRTWSPRDPFVLDVEAVASDAVPGGTGVTTRPRRLELGARLGRAGTIALVLLVVGIGIGGATWVRAVRGHDTIPPNYDASQHGFFVSRIETSGATDASDVVVSDSRGRSKAADYYPLALHSSLAVAARATGTDASDLLTGVVILMGAVVLPCGLYALTRRIVPREPLAAGFAAVLAALFSVFPYKPIGWGGITLIVGVALLPAVVVLLERTVTRALTVAGGILAALSVMAVLAVHNSQMPMLGVMVALLLLETAALARSWRRLGEALLRTVMVGVGALVLFAPTLLSFAGGVSERSDFRDTSLVPLDFVLGQLVTLHAYVPSPQGWLTVLTLLGAGVLVWRHRPAWVAGTAIVFFLVVAAAVSDSGLVGALTFAWYRQPERIAYYLVYFVPVLGGVALAAACTAVAIAAARLPRARVWALPGAAVVALAVVALAGGSNAAKVNRDLVTTAYTQYAPVGPAEVAAFDWLGDHASDRGLVLTDANTDGSVWMYAFSGANPLFAAYPQRDSPFRDRSVRDRDYVREHITDLGRDPKLARLLDRYGIRYVYYGDRTFQGADHQIDFAALRSNPRLREVFSRGGAHVFAITPRRVLR